MCGWLTRGRFAAWLRRAGFVPLLRNLLVLLDPSQQPAVPSGGAAIAGPRSLQSTDADGGGLAVTAVTASDGVEAMRSD